jgi:AcrR family transcriptional regulator
MQSPKKQMLIDIAEGLFYREGFHATGVDRIQAESGVAKTTLYKHFASKEDLILAVLERADERERNAIMQVISGHQGSACELLMKLFRRITEKCQDDHYNGCLFANAAAEFMQSAGPIKEVFRKHLSWLHQCFRDILKDSGADISAATTVLVLYEGVLVVGRQIPGEQLLADLEPTLRGLASPVSA